jgi:hypothetical protein
MARPVGWRSVKQRVHARSDLPSMFVGAGDGLEASQESVAADELELGYVARELEVLLSLLAPSLLRTRSCGSMHQPV